MTRELTAAEAEQIRRRRWELVDDQSVTQADLNAFYAGDDWQSYLRHIQGERLDNSAAKAFYGA